MKQQRDLEWLLALTPKQFAGSSKVVTDSQRRKSANSLRQYWSNPKVRLAQSQRMRGIKKDWSWNGARSGGGNPNARGVITPDGKFPSVADAANFYAITGEGIRHRIKRRWPGYGYEGDVVSHDPIKPNSAYRWVKTPLGEFFTLVAAAKALNVTTVTVRARIKRKVEGYAYID